MISLTPRQRELYDLLVRHASLGGGRLSARQIGEGLGIGKSSAQRLLAGLDARLTDADRAAMVPRAPDGAPLRFIPVAMPGGAE